MGYHQFPRDMIILQYRLHCIYLHTGGWKFACLDCIILINGFNFTITTLNKGMMKSVIHKLRIQVAGTGK